MLSGSSIADFDVPLPSSDLLYLSAPHVSFSLLYPLIFVLKTNFKDDWIVCF